MTQTVAETYGRALLSIPSDLCPHPLITPLLSFRADVPHTRGRHPPGTWDSEPQPRSGGYHLQWCLPMALSPVSTVRTHTRATSNIRTAVTPNPPSHSPAMVGTNRKGYTLTKKKTKTGWHYFKALSAHSAHAGIWDVGQGGKSGPGRNGRRLGETRPI